MSFRFFVPASRRAAHGAGWLALAVALQGCSADIMRGYVGRPPEAVMARYGPPVDVRDLPDGRRAYQWMEVETTTSGGSETTTYERGRRRTEYAPTTTAEKRCFYTFYARQSSGRWFITNFRKPKLECE